MPNDNSGLVGAWSLSSTGNPMAQTFFFFPDGSYVMTDPQGDIAPQSCGGPGYEKGTYTYDTASKTLAGVSSTLDSNGCAGFHDSTAAGTGFGPATQLIFSADGKSLVFTGASFTLYRQTP
jgi:hypothetical protein